MQRACREAKLPLVCGKIKHCKKQQWCVGLALLLLPSFLVKRQTAKSRRKRKRKGEACPHAVGLHKPPLSWNTGDSSGRALWAVGHWERCRSFVGCLQSETELSLEDHNAGGTLLKQPYLFGYAPLPSVSSHIKVLAVKNLDLLRPLRFVSMVWRWGMLK